MILTKCFLQNKKDSVWFLLTKGELCQEEKDKANGKSLDLILILPPRILMFIRKERRLSKNNLNLDYITFVNRSIRR